MIGIIDYGLGNIKAFGNVYNNLGMPFLVCSNKEDLLNCKKIILPGVGAFDQAMDLLNKSGLRESLEELVLQHEIPILGICVGMQILGRVSEEGQLPGLGWIDGVVKKLDSSGLSYKTHLPHMGWNEVNLKIPNKLFKNMNKELRFYFLHSYYFHCFNQKDTIATTEYGINFSCAINSKNIYGVQFHPEKSHQNGIQLLDNFGKF